VPTFDELELLPSPRMKGVRHPHPRQIAQIRGITRNRRIDPTPEWSRSTPKSD
jgi:hypothetical protein